MSATAAIDREIDRELLGLLREKTSVELDRARAALESARDEVDRLEAKLLRVEERMFNGTQPTTPKTEIIGKGGRVKKGLSDKLIAEFLQAANGVGASMEQITSSTNTTTSSARRTIKKLISEKKIEVLGRARWRWKTPSPPSKNLDDY